MKISFVLASLLIVAPFVGTSSLTAGPTQVENNDSVAVMAYALGNYSAKALDVAVEYSYQAGIKGTYAGAKLADLIDDTEDLERSAKRVARLLEDDASEEDLDRELETLEVKFQAAYRGSSDVMTQLQSQGKASQAYALRTAYTKIRSRFVYLQAQLAE